MSVELPSTFERRWPTVILTPITIANFIITVSDVTGLYTKQKVTLSAPGQSPGNYRIVRVLSNTQIQVGPVESGNMTQVLNPTQYSGGTLTMGEQERNKIGYDIALRACYAEEPIVALRNVLVDKYGAFYDPSNPLPISFDGTVQIGDVSIVYNGNTMVVNPDGSINVIVESEPASNSQVISTYGEVIGVSGGVTTQLVTYTVPAGYEAIIQRCQLSGENIARYDLLINSTVVDTVRTYYGSDLTERFDWTTGNNSGYIVNAGSTISVQVLHNRPYSGTFEARLQVLQVELA
jgi:hypothetical protein